MRTRIIVFTFRFRGYRRPLLDPRIISLTPSGVALIRLAPLSRSTQFSFTGVRPVQNLARQVRDARTRAGEKMIQMYLTDLA
jgi:hypothetical protein